MKTNHVATIETIQ